MMGQWCRECGFGFGGKIYPCAPTQDTKEYIKEIHDSSLKKLYIRTFG